jgi:hypothetical protein
VRAACGGEAGRRHARPPPAAREPGPPRPPPPWLRGRHRRAGPADRRRAPSTRPRGVFGQAEHPRSYQCRGNRCGPGTVGPVVEAPRSPHAVVGLRPGSRHETKRTYSLAATTGAARGKYFDANGNPEYLRRCKWRLHHDPATPRAAPFSTGSSGVNHQVADVEVCRRSWRGLKRLFFPPR